MTLKKVTMEAQSIGVRRCVAEPGRHIKTAKPKQDADAVDVTG